MKVVLNATLLIALTVSMTACKSSGDKALRGFYKDINRQTRLDSYLVEDHTQTAGVKKQPQTAEETKKQDYISEIAYLELVRTKDVYKVKYDNSEITNSDVYLEAARHRKAMEENAKQEAAKAKSAGGSIVLKDKPQSTDADKNLVREESVTFQNKSDESNIKTYSVIIGSFLKTESVDRLIKAFADSNEKVTFVKNRAGFSHAVIDTFDSYTKALEKLKAIDKEYRGQYTTAQLDKKYGIPFNDLWILKKN